LKPLSGRLDEALVARGLARDLKEARALILAGQVLSGDTLLESPAVRILPEASLRLRGVKLFASRAGAKLEAALDAGSLDVRGRLCLDLGASTGGFTDCLLQRGAARVVAVDVGHNQLAWSLRSDPRVLSLEGLDYRAFDPAPYGVPGFACADLSFTSVQPLFPLLARWLEPGRGAWAVLVKPQFEASVGEVSPGGLVRDSLVRERILAEASRWAEEAGLSVSGSLLSPVPGAKGNREWLLFGTLA
jgi:23S rRNA (cytidine1920-2'-O)/16S rRNA (cytidine1409-2'-O)-methyltransferase